MNMPAFTRSRGAAPAQAIDAGWPQVFRSAYIDRAEPDAGQRTAAHGLMAASAGIPLPPLVRRSMEGRIGADFGAVRVHSGSSIARAADLLAARAMTRGSDIFMPSGMPDGSESESMPLLAHELTHAASHFGHEASTVQRSPLVLAQRESSEEQRADQIERAVSSELRSRDVQPSMTLARTPATAFSPAMPLTVTRTSTPDSILREGSVTESASPAAQPSPAAPADAAAPNAGQLAEKVYALLERRMLVERERGGHRR